MSKHKAARVADDKDGGKTSDGPAAGKNAEQNSSFGDNSVSVTPKDVSSDEAASKDVVERKITSSDADEKCEAMLDDAVELTFPASDPPAIGSITRIEIDITVDTKKEK